MFTKKKNDHLDDSGNNNNRENVIHYIVVKGHRMQICHEGDWDIASMS